jgi:hypothetical protein
MKQHEREFFIATIRSGKVSIKNNDISLVVYPPTVDQSIESCEIYNDAYETAYIDGMMNEDEMNDWMLENGLWSEEEDGKTEGFKKDLERLKIEIYNARNDSNLRERIRLYIRAGENQMMKHISKKNIYFQNTVEGFATSEKIAWIIKNTTYYRNKHSLYNFNDISLAYVVEEWQNSFLTDAQTRELARNEPWRSLWVVKDNCNIKLFTNKENSELTHNQKNLIVWSQMYDNIQESIDCPPKDVIEDDDMLDGWFIIQAKKRDQEKAEQELNNSTKSEKIKNASEVFVMAKDKNDVSRVESMNTVYGQSIKKQRQAMVQQRGAVNQQDFIDERRNIQMQQNNQMRGHIKGG